MTERDVEKFAYRDPFQPYRLVLPEGEEVVVTQPRKAVVSGGYVALAGTSRRPNDVGRHGLRFIRVDRILAAETIAASPGGKISGNG